jgi:molybdate transport system substrate-binding protein
VRRRSLLILTLVLATGACSSSSSTSTPGSGGSAAVTVFAASSLTGAFTKIGADFQIAHPGTTVATSFGPSDGLAGQIESEGTADVFASASAKWMDDVSKKVGVSDETTFATNKLVIITPTDNPAQISNLQDLAKPGVQLVLATAGVPVGDYAREVLKNAGIAAAVEANVVSNEQDDASLVARIVNGEADAAIVYLSDVTSTVAPTVHSVSIPTAVNVVATYPIAVLNGSTDATTAAAFVDYVAGPQGQATLAAFGFLPPPKA